MNYEPDLNAIRKLAQTSSNNLAPVYRDIPADLETPVSAFLKVARGDYSFLLESVERGERLARYSFIGTAEFSDVPFPVTAPPKSQGSAIAVDSAQESPDGTPRSNKWLTVIIVGLILAGVAMFFLPLLSIRKRLQEAKRQELSWVTPHYTTIIEKLKEQISKTPTEESANETKTLADELTMVRQIQQDIQKIQSWPFDLGVVSRLATVLVIPPILGVLARILILVFLRL